MNVECLTQQANLINTYQALPKFPTITRDLAVILPEQVSAAEVRIAIFASAGSLLTDVRLFDVYTGEQVPQGSRSLAFSLTFRSLDRTLTDIEVDECHKKIVSYLENTFTAKLR
jgi:phenylalanyl-tRNA synthetase beta chain